MSTTQITVATDATGFRVITLPGGSGWSPVFAAEADGSHRVLKVVDWVGGTGAKPTIGQYVGSSGLTSNIANALDIRGVPGQVGVNWRGEWAPGTSYLANDLYRHLGEIYIVLADHTSASTWSQLHAELAVAKGDPGDVGPSAGVAVFNTPSSGGTPTPAAPAAAKAIGNLVMAIGDSITAFGDNGQTAGAQTGVSNPSVTARSWLAWASMLSGGRIRYGGVSATGGYTTSQILTTHLPRAIAAAPSACLVLGGRNDVFQAIAFSSTTANLASIYTQLAAAGILPVLCTMTPIAGAPDSQMLATSKINDWIRAKALANKWPLVDLHAAGINPLTGQWAAGYNVDVSHPSVTGVRAMGQAVAGALAPWMTPYALPVAVAQYAAGQSTNAITNALSLTDSNSDGTPDGWTLQTGSGFTCTMDDASIDGVIGNWWTINRTAGTSAVTFLGPAITTALNDKVAMGFAIKATSVESGGAQISVALVNAANLSQVVAGIYGWNADIASPGVFYCQGLANAGQVVPLVTISGGTGVLKLGRLTAVNLTANGTA